MTEEQSGEEAPKEEVFSTTMRIDITPHLKEQLASSFGPGPAQTRRTGRVTIKIPKKTGDASDLGSSDFQEILQNVYDATLITDQNGRIASVNPRAIQFFRGERAEIVGRNIVELISGASEDLVPTIRKNLENDRYTLIQAYCLRGDGTIFPAEISANHLHLSARDYLSFFIRDISWRKEAEERLRTGYTAIQNSGDGIAIADLEGAISFCNPAMTALCGEAATEHMIGRNLREFLAEPDKADEILQNVSGHNVWVGELEMRRVDGATFYAQGSVAPNVNADDELTGMVLSVLDITNLKQAQYQLECFARELQEKNTLLESDQIMAREIQQAFLPRQHPVFPRGAKAEDSILKVGHLYLPSGAVGGDFFDMLVLSDSQAGLFISDVAGHGMRAALVVATIRGLMEELAPIAGDPAAFLTQLNRAYTGIFSQTEQLTFTTACYLVLDLKTGRMQYTTAGHPFPFHLRRSAGTVSMLPAGEGGKGPALGLFDTASYGSATGILEPGDVLLFYTDGLSEAEGTNRELFEDHEMVASLQKLLPKEPGALLTDLVAAARQFKGATDFEDDVCLLAVELARLLS
ncbi:MAG TPA: SpoIIE family protein phosphatase [Kiritimatiellia bacterium]|nr:SpoIIE family protein phosphatase [Kiritimatiellia bacterium]HRZ11237.1 SpoIIE family protein phosphatase [Kiritimatiellia bacterium]HSA19088.1 SpoIIE family protein phosphatase [Kiritimatiellia bacterium]